jgi:hypothetical protein
MSARTIGGPLGMPELVQLHRPPGAAQVSDARRNVRAALAALRAIDGGSVSGDAWSALGRVASTLVDCVGELERIERHVNRGGR